MEKKQKVGAIFKIAGFLAFIMLGWLGIRGYKSSVEKLKTNGCIDEIIELSRNIQDYFASQHNYGELNYKMVESYRLFPSRMMREGFREATNSYIGGVDIWYSSTSPEDKNTAFEISFQGLSTIGCQNMFRINWDANLSNSVIAVAAFPTATPAGVLDDIYLSTKSSEIRSGNKFKAGDAPYISNERARAACACEEDTCSFIWKFS